MRSTSISSQVDASTVDRQSSQRAWTSPVCQSPRHERRRTVRTAPVRTPGPNEQDSQMGASESVMTESCAESCAVSRVTYDHGASSNSRGHGEP